MCIRDSTLSIHKIVTRKRELFYWSAILCTFALGTASGDLATEALGLGFTWGALSFSGLITATYVVWRMGGNAVLTFWIGYILTPVSYTHLCVISVSSVPAKSDSVVSLLRKSLRSFGETL